MTTAASSTVALAGGADACNVFWQIGSSATLGAGSQLIGTVVAKVSVTTGADVNVAGRLLAEAAVSLNTDTVSAPDCRTATTVSLTSSPSTVRLGRPVTLTAAVAPADATGSVVFSDASGSGQVTSLGSAPLVAGTASLSLPLSGFGPNTVTASYSGDPTHSPSVSAPVVIEVTAYVGEVVVTELRASGPGGTDDSYVELYNTGPPVPLAGFSVVSSSGTTTTLPSTAGTLGTGRSYLLTGSGFSLGALAHSDLRLAGLDSGGVKVLAPDSAATRTDAVGSVAGFRRGTGLAAFTATPTGQYAWCRSQRSGLPVNTGSNAGNFQLVSRLGGLVGGLQSTLGAPSPTGTADAYQHNATMASTLLDPASSASAAPNRLYVAGDPGTLTIRRRITNSTGATVTAASVRITALSEAHGPPQPGVTTQPASRANLRAIAPATDTSSVPISSGATRTVQNLQVGAPNTADPGGGLNSTFAIPLPPGGLSGGASVDVSFTFAVDTRGTFWFGYDVDALIGAGSVAQMAARGQTTPGTAADTGQLRALA